MHFYLLRRYRRRRLFPPGLLALAGLLWLGCVQAGAWREQLKRSSVLQLTMPKPRSPKDAALFPTVRWGVPDPDTLRAQYTWHEAALTGERNRAGRQHHRIAARLRAIMADTLHAGALRVRIAPQARYADMVFLLDLMDREGVAKYWLDITRKPTTFYVIHGAGAPRRFYHSSNVYYNEFGRRGHFEGCILYYDDLVVPKHTTQPFMVVLDNWTTDFWQRLRQPEWRISIWLLAAVLALSSRRLLQLWLVR